MQEISEGLLNEEVARVRTGLSGSSGSQDKSLKLGGEILAFIAMQIVVPIVSSFVSDLLYDKYKNVKAGRQLEQAKSDLLGVTVAAPRVSQGQVIDEMTQVLINEGVPAVRAEQIVLETYTRIASRLCAAGPATA